MVSLQRKLYFSKDRGGPTFLGEGGGSRVQVLISIETHITCEFPGEGGPAPLSLLWIRTWSHRQDNSTSLHV